MSDWMIDREQKEMANEIEAPTSVAPTRRSSNKGGRPKLKRVKVTYDMNYDQWQAGDEVVDEEEVTQGSTPYTGTCDEKDIKVIPRIAQGYVWWEDGSCNRETALVRIVRASLTETVGHVKS